MIDLYERARPAWQRHGECDEDDRDIFFPSKGESTKPAKAICARCPVRTECLEYALAEGVKFGIWGGTSEADRRVLRRQRRLAALGAA